MKTKYVFPAVLEPEKYGGFSVYFPDITGCYTQGNSLEDAISRAEDALCLMLYDMEESAEAIPTPSPMKEIEASVPNDHTVTYIKCDTLDYRRYFDNKAVKKTLSIPSWLNTIAEREGVNFSYLLQSALKQTLGIDSSR